MTIPFFCIFLSMLLLVVSKAPLAIAMFREGGYDNHHPREQQKRLKGWGSRALAAHQNEIEAFPIFAAGVIIAHLGHGDPTWAANLSIIYLVARISYLAMYLMDLDKIRSLIWGVGYGSSLLLALLPLING